MKIYNKYVKGIINTILVLVIIIVLYMRNWTSNHKCIKGNIMRLDIKKIYHELYKPEMKFMSVKRNWNGDLKITYLNRIIIGKYNNMLIDIEGNKVQPFPYHEKLITITGHHNSHTLKQIAILEKYRAKIDSIFYKNGLWIVMINNIMIKTHDLKRIIQYITAQWFDKNIIESIDLRYKNTFLLVRLQKDQWNKFIQYRKNEISANH